MSNTRIKISVDLPHGQVFISDPETDKPLYSVEGVILTMLPGRTQASLIVDEPIINGEWEVPVAEQMVISSSFMALLAERVESALTRKIEELTDWHNRIAAHEQTASDIGPAAVDGIAMRVVEYLDAREKSRTKSDQPETMNVTVQLDSKVLMEALNVQLSREVRIKGGCRS